MFKISTTYTHNNYYEDWEECELCEQPATDTITGSYTGTGRGFELEAMRGSSYEGYDAYGYGLYKFYNNRAGSQPFYLDIRDNNYSQLGYNQHTDFLIRYNYAVDSYEISPAFYADWKYINSEELVTIWDVFYATESVETSDLPNFWSSCLLMVKNNNHPYLIWGAHPTFNATSYKLYRSVTNDPFGKYAIIATTNNNIFDFIDYNTSYFSVNPVYYYVKAYNGYYSTRTNIVGTPISKLPKISDNFFDEDIFNFNLYQNYPNPFNPTTIIEYSLKESGIIKLNVFNTLGEEIKILVNKFQEKGNYSVKFDAAKLSSGIYYYRISVNDFVSVKKMILTK